MKSVAALALGLVLLVVGAGVCAEEGETASQVVEPLNPGVEQRVETLGDQGQQRVVVLDPSDPQAVASHEPPSPAAKTASKVGQFLLGLTAAVVAVGVMAAQLIFL